MALFTKGFASQLSDPSFCDLTLRVGAKSSEKKVFNCHQLIVSYSSAYLAKRIENAPRPESVLSSVVVDVDLPHSKALKHFDKIIDYMYKGEYKIGLKNVVTLYVLAEFLQIPQLCAQATDFLEANVTREKVLDVLGDAFRMDAKPILTHLCAEIARNFSEYVDDKNFRWASLPFDFMVSLLHSPLLLAASEADVFSAISSFLQGCSSLTEEQAMLVFETVRFEQLDFESLEAALAHPLVPKQLLSEALMVKLAKFEKRGAQSSSSVGSPASRRVKRRTSYGRLFQYSNDWDNRGVIYFFGSAKYKQPFQNPMLGPRPEIVVSFSSLEKGTPSAVLERDPREVWTQDVPSSWVQIDLGEGRRLKLTAYTIRHGVSSKQDFIRNWSLKASIDGVEFDTLKRHKDDESLNSSNFATATWKLSAQECTKAYRVFRIVQTGHNSSKHNFLAVSGLELYGELIFDTTKA
eukprot:TRINITY_DN13784_c0_g1_i1.p1 TRINITY_DN13784_c0_g1~~TRINITY_DN13784_c0_g1_i1.p1  ORF type:complete len:464 (-),score=96.24 TRINITY_DN13784_c0_g1_i1:51-1442(-)